MAIPDYTLDGIIPPFIGSSPSFPLDLMSPYLATSTEVVNHFMGGGKRKAIIIGWLKYREALRREGIVQGCQWLGGSFLEDKEKIRGEEPNDLDLVFFFRRPENSKNDEKWLEFYNNSGELFNHSIIKRNYMLDAFFVDMDGGVEDLLLTTRYYLQLFSHQRDTFLWKGMIEVRHEDEQGEDAHLLSLLLPMLGT